MNFPIDFVVTWVDGSDPNWRARKRKYDSTFATSENNMNSDKAYREWGTFKYWFRGVEKFAPWVNKVYLVTDNQIPDWLDVDNSKLDVIDHKENIKYHVACKANGDGCMDESKFDGVTKINEHEFELHNAHCFKIDVPQIGPAQAIYYDVAALKACCEHIKENHISHPIVYIMACRIGPFAGYFYREIHKLGGTVYLNPDGHEWMRAKWSAPIRKYWKISEQMMVKYCDLAICDSVNIEKYIHECYDGKGIKGRNPKTTFIAYGADLTLSKLADDDEKLVNWYKEKGLTKKDYYLVVGRFVPENSFEVMIREFMKSKSKKNFAIITNVNEKFLNELEEKLHFKSDKRIKFVGTVYDQELLKKIRENAYAYFHGHTVGGTNPSLIEALGSTDLNLLVDVGFNKEVAEDCALYWSRKPGSLAKLIDKADQMSADEIAEMGRRAKKRVAEEYTHGIRYVGSMKMCLWGNK